MSKPKYTTLFLDIGGVILTNGWDRTSRQKAAATFHLDLADLDKRHALTFDTYEIGKITLDHYLDRAVFYTPRPFTREEFKTFMYAQSQPHPDMLALIREIKKQYGIKIVALSNEGRELMVHRIHEFHLKEFIDFFICSAFIGLRKPDVDMYRMALEIAHVQPKEVIYLDDRELLSEIGAQIGLCAVQHKTFIQTQDTLYKLLKG